MAELTDGESDDRTVISDRLPRDAGGTGVAPARPRRPGRVPFAGWQGRGGRRVSLTPLQLGGLLLVAAVGGGFAGGVLRPTSPAVAVSESATAAPAPPPVITPLPAQEEIIPPRPAGPGRPRRSRGRPRQGARAGCRRQAAAAPAAKAPGPAAKVAEATPPPAAPAKPRPLRRTGQAGCGPCQTRGHQPGVTRPRQGPDRPARRTAAVNRRPAAKKKKFVDPFE